MGFGGSVGWPKGIWAMSCHSLGTPVSFFDFVVDEGVVVLEVDAESQVGQGGPDGELHHAVGLLGPDGEVLGVERELGGHVVDDGRVVEVEDRAIGCGEGVDLGFCRGEVGWRDDFAERIHRDFPDGVVRFAKGDDGFAGLHVEGRRYFADDVFDGLGNGFLGNRDVFAESVVRAPVADGCDEVGHKSTS